jgi:hypothetical protein
VDAFPQWTDFHIQRLEKSARGLSNPTDWFCRAEPLPISDVLAIETRSWRGAWMPLASREVALVDDAHGALAMFVAGNVCVSKQFELPSGVTAYEFTSAGAAPGGKASIDARNRRLDAEASRVWGGPH